MSRGKAALINRRPHLFHLVVGLLVVFGVTACQIETADTTEHVSTAPVETSVAKSTSTSSEPTQTSTTSPKSTTSFPDSTATTEGKTTNAVRCRPDPFAIPFRQQLAEKYPGKQITAHLFDNRTGCHYRLNPDNRQPTASVFKVMVMAGTLLEAQTAGRSLTEFELSQLTPMITRSTNPQVRALWRSFGGSPWFRTQAESFGLKETTITADRGTSWGLTKTSASDQVSLLRQLLVDEDSPIDAEYQEKALALMTSVVPEQTWGITADVPSSWTVAQKNGFAGATTNSVGWVDEPGESDGYLVAILSTGWPNFEAGIPAVEEVSRAIAAAMFDTIPGVE